MSQATREALEQAISDHVADECEGGTLTGYIVQAQYTDLELMDDGRTGYLRVIPDMQSYTVSLGLSLYLHTHLKQGMFDDE